MKRMIFFVAFAALLAATYFISRERPQDVLKIAIITPTTHPSLEEIERGFRETIHKLSPKACQIKTYNGHANKTLLRAEVENAAHSSYDLVLAIGSGTAQMSQEVFLKRNSATPIVFTAVAKPHKLSLQSLSGVKEEVDFEKLLSLLPYLGRDIRTVLVVYDPNNHGLKEDRQDVEKILKQMNIALKSVEVFRSNEIQAKALAFIDSVDAVLVLKDNTVVSGLDSLLNMCEKRKIPLIACDLDSVDRGACFAHGVNEYAFGSDAAKLGLQIALHNDRKARIVGVSQEHFSFKFNEKSLQSLGIDIQQIKENIHD